MGHAKAERAFVRRGADGRVIPGSSPGTAMTTGV